MIKIIGALVLYMIIGGAMAALAINIEASKCGPQRVDTKDYAAIVIVWPAFLGTVIVLDVDSLKPAKCAEDSNDHD